MRKAKNTSYPHGPTQFAYYMQAIEPTDELINAAFPGFHPAWVIKSQKTEVSPERLIYLRKELLKLSKVQCAAFFRVSKNTLDCWERGYMPIPFMALELLRLVYESPEFNLSSPKWAGWFINQEGRLVCPDTGNLSFSPSDLTYVREIHQHKSLYETENTRLRAEIERLKTENAELSNGMDSFYLLEELKQIEARLGELSQMAGKKKVVKLFPKQEPQSQEEKCA